MRASASCRHRSVEAPVSAKEPGDRAPVRGAGGQTDLFTYDDASDIDEINPMLLVWCRDIAGQRIHGVTGRKPLEVFDATEQAHLAALPARRYEPTVW